MTLKEALESNKPFRIKGRATWLSPKAVPNLVFDSHDVLSDDWEIKPELEVYYIETDDSGRFFNIHRDHVVSLREGHRLIKVKEVSDEN